ncbi:adenylyltransferase/sulfurtransferase [Microbacterium resistens]|uniref:Adenylyltransferase/sulfurtransferase n=1 Tax=Microbacterium resistens TaxID=156977 RepID=A0ABU1SDQ6_9MICO|nr:ThiF family adenylyltransferase [Microbacterium resistens]MDR6867735.1 adenylyltransferase/sulfurtransferase [Microbacterium resistens]
MLPLVEPGPVLEPERIARYSRQLMLPGFGEDAQRRLRAARVLVIGAGGLGSAVVPLLAGTGIGTIGVLDDDRVELSNLPRQLSHGVADVGRLKTESLAETVRAIDPECDVVLRRERADSANIVGILSGYDLVIDGSDNFPTRYLINDAADLAGKPLIWGSILRFHGQVGVSWRGRGPTFRDLFPVPPAADGVLSCELGGVLPSLCATVGSLLAAETVKIVTGIGDPLIGRVLFYDALAARTREIAFEASEDAEPVTGLIDYELFCGTRDDTIPSLSAAELLRRVRSAETVTLYDVREPEEMRRRRIPGAIALPLARIESGEEPEHGPVDRPEHGPEHGPERDGAVVLYCERDPRSQRAARILRERGHDVSYLVGGIRAYAAVGGRTTGEEEQA